MSDFFREKILPSIYTALLLGVVAGGLSFLTTFKLLEGRVAAVNSALDANFKKVGVLEADVDKSIEKVNETIKSAIGRGSLLQTQLAEVEAKVAGFLAAANIKDEEIKRLRDIETFFQRNPDADESPVDRLAKIEKRSLYGSVKTDGANTTIISDVPLQPTGALCFLRINSVEHEYCALLAINHLRDERIAEVLYSDGPQLRPDGKPYPRPKFHVNKAQRLEIIGDYPPGITIQYNFFGMAY